MNLQDTRSIFHCFHYFYLSLRYFQCCFHYLHCCSSGRFYHGLFLCKATRLIIPSILQSGIYFHPTLRNIQVI
uniref:Acyltransferase-like protein At1g54570ic isoform X2 n=1 Tax=Rhizophora mucronata TaxID=61149 RepID=A0A2P2K8V1_RHIMU